MTRAIVTIAAALAVALPGRTRAQGTAPAPAPPPTAQPAPVEPVPVQPAPAQPAPAQPKPPQEEPSFQFSLQGEVGAGKTAGDLKTNTDVVYGAIIGLHFRGPLGLELDYQHAENDVSDTSGRARFKQDGLLGHVRFDVLRTPVTPFIYAGLGWVHYNADSTALAEKADRLVIPAGVGLELHVSALVVGARGEYQWNTSDIAGKHVDYWKAVGTVGFRLP
jgi:hypothetical protein